MPPRIVLDHPRRYLGRRTVRKVAFLAGVVLFAVGIAASVVAVPATLLAAAWLLGEDIALELAPGLTLSADMILVAWATATVAAILGIGRGLRLMRGGRALVLFLRRFGYDDATSAVTFAVTRTIGSSWRLVTLDDAEIAPLGVATGARRLFGALATISSVLGWLVKVLLRIFPSAQLGLWIVVAIDLVRVRIWERASDQRAWMAVLDPYIEIVVTTLSGRLPLNAVGLDLPGAFALCAVVVAGIVIGLGTALAAAPLAWAVSAAVLFLSSFPADAVQEAERSKTREVRTDAALGTAVHELVEKGRRVFGPRLVVLRVASDIWRQAVVRLASAASLTLIDVSDPSENVIWEIEELTVRSRTRCIFICQHDKALQLANPQGGPAGALDTEVARLLELEEILAYTTDRRGRKRFARALRSTLLTRSGSGAASAERVPAAQG